jgi:hypothetical protein
VSNLGWESLRCENDIYVLIKKKKNSANAHATLASIT